MKLQGLEHRIERRGRVIARVYHVEPIRYPLGGMPRHELPDRLRIELAPGYAQGMRGTFRSLEDFVPDGDGGLHALGITTVIPACKRSLLFSIRPGWSLPIALHGESTPLPKAAEGLTPHPGRAVDAARPRVQTVAHRPGRQILATERASGWVDLSYAMHYIFGSVVSVQRLNGCAAVSMAT